MPTHKFEPTKGLLSDVIGKQAGSLEKAILEAVMNSIDAGASNIDLLIEKDRAVIEDDGKGMTRDEVQSYFKKFGLKDDDVDEKEFGKFRMGRGQIFSFGENVWHSKDNIMGINIDGDYVSIHEDVLGDFDEDESIRREESFVLFPTPELSFVLQNASDEYEGCRIEVALYNELGNVDSKVSDIKKLIHYIPFMFDVEIVINGAVFEPDFEFDEETPNAYYKIGQSGYSYQTTLYNKGARVMDDSINKTGGVIITKKDLDVNFARNAVLEGDHVWEVVQKEYREFTIEHVINNPDRSDRESIWLLNEAVGDDEVYGRINNVELLKDINGNRWSLKQLSGRSITFADKNNDLAQKAMENGDAIVLDRDYEAVNREIASESEVLNFEQVIDEKMAFEMKEYSDNDISKKRLKNLARARWAAEQAGYGYDIKAGYSQTRKFWKDDDNTIFIHKDYLKCSKTEFVTKGLIMLIEMMAHHGSSKEETTHGYRFEDNLWKYTEPIGGIQYMILNGNADIERFM